MISFLYPKYLYGLILVAVLYYFCNLGLKKKRKLAIRFSNLGFIKDLKLKQPQIEKTFLYMYLITLTLLIVGLADPHLPLKRAKEGTNVVLAIDVSGSMKATDYKPSRIEAAKKAATTLLKGLKPKDNVGIIIFESGATTAAYLTPFKEKVIEKLEDIEASDGRTAIGDGLSLAIDMVTSIPKRKKVVILLSDGVNNAGVITPEEAIRFAKKNKIQIYTIGMGSEEKTIIDYDWFGNPVYAELDEDLLKMIAVETGGKYYKSVNEKTLNEIYKNIKEDIKRERELTSVKDLFILLALSSILIQLYLRYGKKVVMP